MKTKKNLMVHTLGVFLIALSGIITSTACMGFLGEPEPPKSLLK